MNSLRTEVTERVSAIDRAWLRMDSDTNAMVITALMKFDDPPSFDEVRRIAATRLLDSPRFCARVAENRFPFVAPRWQPDSSFDIDRHVHRVELGASSDIETFVGKLLGTRLPRDRPLWTIYFVELAAGGAALLARIHHAIGDGVALVNMLLAMTDQREVRVADVGLRSPHPHGALEAARELAVQTSTLGRELVLPSDPKTPLRGSLGNEKRAAVSAPISLECVKSIAKRFDAKLNDVLVSAISGALRAYLAGRGGDVANVSLRAMVPVYVRPEGAAPTAGNHFGLVFVPLAIGIADRRLRLAQTCREMNAIKSGREAVVALEVLAALGKIGPRTEALAIDLFTRKASVMVTNIPGPLAKLKLAGKTISSFVVWAPVSGRLGIGLSLMTYGSEIRLAVATDARLVPDPETIVRAFECELAELSKLA